MIFVFEAGFSAAHFYKQAAWSKDENQKIFGKCFTEFGHGHDYKLEIAVDCTCDDATDIRKLVRKACSELDHQHLNFVIDEFKTKIPTTENIAEYLKTQLNAELKNKKAEVLKLRLFESPQVWVEFIS